MEKTGSLLLQWAREVMENIKLANEFQIWFSDVDKKSKSFTDQLKPGLLAKRWVACKVKLLEEIADFSPHWKVSSYYQSWSMEWKNILEKLQNVKPFIPSLNSKEIVLFEKQYRYVDVNLETLENIKKDMQTIISLR